ncbi:MAG: hypothetical protein AAFX09_07695 [Pseudomonadota bacterium]
MDFEIAQLLQGEAMRIWIRIMVWVWALSIFWIAALLLRGGFDDILDIVRSRYATSGERANAWMRMPGRVALLILASVIGATGTALTLWFQGAIAILIWRQVFG